LDKGSGGGSSKLWSIAVSPFWFKYVLKRYKKGFDVNIQFILYRIGTCLSFPVSPVLTVATFELMGKIR